MSISLKRQKNIINTTFFAVLAGLFVCIFFLCPSALADDNNVQKGMIDMIYDGGMSFVYNVFVGGGSGSGAFKALYDFMVNGPSDPGYSRITRTASVAVKALAAGWVVVIAMTHYLQKIEREQDSTEAIFDIMLEISVAGTIVMNADKIVGFVVSIGSVVISAVSPTGPSAASIDYDEILTNLTGHSEGGLIWSLQAILLLFFPWVVANIVTLFVKFIVMSLILEIGIRRVFAPLAIADVYHEGLRSPGMRYLKQFFAVFLRIAIVLVILMFEQKMVDMMTSSLDMAAVLHEADTMSALDAAALRVRATYDYLFMVVIISLACLGLMLKSDKLAGDILGV